MLPHHLHTTPDPPPLPSAGYDYVVAANGVFVRAQTALLTACLCLAPATQPVRGLLPLTPSLRVVSRVPYGLLQVAIDDARRQLTIEHLYRITRTDAQLTLVKPPQRGTPGSVTAPAAAADTLVEIHTHPGSAFFSATDDADETDCRFYLVLGQLTRQLPAVAFRLGVYGHRFPLPLNALFEDIPHDHAHPTPYPHPA